MKRVMVFSLAGLFVLALAGFAPATTWELGEVYPGTMEQMQVSSTEGPGACKTLIDCQIDIGGYGAVEVWVGASRVHFDEDNLDFDEQKEGSSDGDVDLGPHTTNIFRGDAGEGGDGHFKFSLTYPL